MNHYGMMARDAWRRQAPTTFAELRDPDAYFEELGESTLLAIDSTCREMEAQLPSNLTYLQRVQQMQAIRKQAEETVLTEALWAPLAEATDREVSNDPYEQLIELQGNLPAKISIPGQIQQIWEQAEQEANDEGWQTVQLDPEQQAQVEWLTQLEPLLGIDPDTLSPDEQEKLLSRLTALSAARPH